MSELRKQLFIGTAVAMPLLILCLLIIGYRARVAEHRAAHRRWLESRPENYTVQMTYQNSLDNAVYQVEYEVRGGGVVRATDLNTGRIDPFPELVPDIDSRLQAISNRLDFGEFVRDLPGRLSSCLARREYPCDFEFLPPVQYDAHWGYPRTILFQYACPRGREVLHSVEHFWLGDLQQLPVDPHK